MSSESISINGVTYSVHDLTEFGFEIGSNSQALDSPIDGVLKIGEQSMNVRLRVRGQTDAGAVCSFVNISLREKETIRRYLKQRARVGGVSELENRTYDELAEGIVSSSDATTSNTVAATAPKSGYVKTLALMLLLFTMVGMVVLAAVFLRSRSSLSVNNAALVGNYLPINAKVEGEIVEILVSEGDFVKKGDVLIRLHNPEMEAINQQYAAQLATAEAKVKTLERQLEAFGIKIAIATKKLSLDVEVAESEYESAQRMRDSSLAAVQRMRPYVESGSVTQLELDAVENELMAAEAQCVAGKNKIRQLQFSQEAVKSNVLIMGDRLDDELGRLQAELEIAQAQSEEIRSIGEVAALRVSELNVTAPRDGQVYVTYRQVGEYIKIADEVIALSYPGKTWAAGQVTSFQAGRVRPGQPVTVSVPSLDMRLEGFVSAVGHRAMYSHGRYTADFRGETATDVPIKVIIDEIPNDIPSGIRLEMAINTGFGIKWLDDSLGYEVKSIGEESQPAPGPADSKFQSKPTQDKSLIAVTTNGIQTKVESVSTLSTKMESMDVAIPK